jgi:MFS family permease
MVGMIGGSFPLAIAMFNRRTRTQQDSGSLSGFAMGVGYLFGPLGPLLGWLRSATDGQWPVPLTVYALTALPMLIGAWLMSRPDRYLEDVNRRILHPEAEGPHSGRQGSPGHPRRTLTALRRVDSPNTTP